MVFLIVSVLCSIMIFSLQSNAVLAYSTLLPESINLFAGDLLSVIVDQKSTENVVYSPISIYIILALTYMGAGGNTSDELSTALELHPRLGKKYFASVYGDLLKTMLKKPISKYTFQPPELLIASGIYVSKYVEILEQFKETARDNFKAEVENVDFSDNLAVVKKINNWVEQQTANKIKNLMTPNAVDSTTSMVFVNAVYLKANWYSPFQSRFTKKRDFHLNHNEKVKVYMMNKKEAYKYAPLPELNAKAVELQVLYSDISMLIILPNEVDGLKQVEEKLKGKDLNRIIPKMNEEYLNLSLPKFRIEFDIDLREPLEKMGCSSMFGSNANFTDMFVNGFHHRVSQVKHKAYLECDEVGLKAAAGSYSEGQALIGNTRTPTNFTINHPFFFAIRSPWAVYFAGHVVNFD